jgi:hypothetical protein
MSTQKSIPVVGTAVVNSNFWVTRLLMSIDYPVDNFVIINNNGRGELDDDLDNLKKINHKFVKNIKIVHLPANIGVSGAWNLIIKCYMNSPYWVIANDDVSFGPGVLEEMSTKIENDSNLGLIHGNPGAFGVGSWDLFLIRDIIIQHFGLFDENLYPAYCEDADYIMRFIHRPIKKILSLEKPYYHGLEISDGEYHYQTQKNDPSLKEKLDDVNAMNIEYLTTKWGTGWRLCSPTVEPFENQEGNFYQSNYDLEFVRKKHLGF